MSTPCASTLPQTQNTAPVLEFRCLYTQDLRRKQKRWQDGRLKFHTFNKRVMVYDERSNFVGDTHWRDDGGLDEGEELELERGGILVEVGECVGTRDQDLSELVDKRVREREERAAAKASTAPATGPRIPTARPQLSTPAGTVHLRPKPLNAVIGTPTGHYGRAMVSNLSPFEQKHLKHPGEEQDVRPSKRQRQNDTPVKSGYAQNLLGATLNLGSSRPVNTSTTRHQPSKTRMPAPAETVDLTTDEDDDRMGLAHSRVRPYLGQDSTKLPKRKSPLSKSGYARNLTGAALNLSGSIATTGNPRKPPGTIPDPFGTSNGTSFQPPAHQQIKLLPPIAKSDSTRGEEPPRKPRASKSAAEVNLAGPVKTVLKSYRVAPVRGPDATKLIAEQPMTILKIRPRPPRQMMMLMDIPRPRYPNQDSGIEVAPKLCPTSEAGNGSLETPCISLDSSSNHILDGNIIIPSAITVKAGIPDPPEPPNTDHDNHANVPKSITGWDRMAKRELHRPVDGNTDRIRQDPSTFTDNCFEKSLGQQESTATFCGRELVPESTNSPSEAFESRPLHSHTAVRGDTLASTEKPQPRHHSSPDCTSLEPAEPSITPEPALDASMNGGALSTISGLGEHADVSQMPNSDPVPETDHCQQIQVASMNLNRNHSLHRAPAREAVELKVPPKNNFSSPHIETATSTVTIKRSPTSLSPASMTDGVNYPRYSGGSAAQAVPFSTTGPASVQGAPKAEARGVARVVPGPNTSSVKTPVRMSARAESVSIKRDPGGYAPVREFASRGPWSRESFDLFGLWRPHGRAA